jgi:hypothetical protein
MDLVFIRRREKYMVVAPVEFGTQLTRIRNTLKTDQELLNNPAY